MIYEIYLNDSVVIVWDDKQVEKYVIYKNHDKYGNYLAGEDEIIGELLPFARDIFKLIISMYKLKKYEKNKDGKNSGYHKYSIPGSSIYAIRKYNVDVYELEADDTIDETQIETQIDAIYYKYFNEYERIVDSVISKRISEINKISIFSRLESKDSRIYKWYETHPRNGESDDYIFRANIKINVINPDVRIKNTEWISDERRGSEYVNKYRKSEVSEILKELDEKNVIALVGVHGIGKSMLAETVVAEYLNNKDSFLFWLDYAGEKSFNNFICKINQKWDPNPGYGSIDKIIQALNEDTHYIDKECVIVIDNLNYSNDTFFVEMNDFISKLRSNIKVIITSTNTKAVKSDNNTLIYAVEPLCKNNYELLWKDITGIEELGDEFEEFSSIISKNTLLTVLVGSILCDYREIWREKLKEINSLLSRVEIEKSDDWATNETDSNPHYNQEEGNLFSYISKLFKFDLELDAKEINLLECLALYPITGVSLIEFEKLYGNNCRQIIRRKLESRHWIVCDTNDTDTFLKLHPVVRNYILKRKDDDTGIELYNILSKKEFIQNVEKLVSETADRNLYDLLPISELIYNICYYLSPLTKRFLEMPHEELVKEEENRLFDEDGNINKRIIKKDAGDILDFDMTNEIMQIVYQYSTFVEDTYLHDFSRVFPLVASVLRFLKYKYGNKRDNLTVRDLRWIQGCGYSYLHTNTNPVSELKKRELNIAYNTLEFARKELKDRKESLENNNKFDSNDYIECVKSYCMVHGNIAAYYIRLAELEGDEGYVKKAYDEYVLSLEIRLELLYFLDNSEYWNADDEYDKLRDEVMLLIATAKENIGYSIMKMKNPDYCVAINEYKDAYEIRKRISRKEDRLLGSYMKYVECFVLLVENNKDYLEKSNKSDMLDLFFKAKIELINAYCKGKAYSEKALEKMLKICNSISDENSSFLGRDEWINSIEKANNK